MAARIYLAGFDVFRPDAVARGEYLKQLCLDHGYAGLFPLDNRIPPGLDLRAQAEWIYRENTALIRSADLVMANLNPFRGAEPDSGTAFEVGYAVALGIPVWAYTGQSHDLVAQVGAGSNPAVHGGIVDAQGYMVENFGLNLNLMLACSCTVVVGDAAACLARIAAG
ncbi:nucleoside 2-deoxyribosyltransferase [Bordetella sp. 2513F-2]